ncbi:hypothetical protein D9758_010482 [Tetrapyrgos nigripes]|uniref:Chromatin modification-related protein EAF3 n=1 Tax=Tetrapyrgos nigripes TaxID=182062 RepID=A0A8H5CZS5_9AGAR|nr:hypothetical protein D9758_010482 [Tetrapyrgos nigripes]
MADSSDQPTYNLNERCLCYHGPLIYEAKILKIQDFPEPVATTGVAGTHFFVHYKGWKQTWDEWVPPTRLLKLDETNIAKQKSLNEQAKAANAASSNKAHGKSSATSARDRESISAVGTRAGARKDGARGVKRAREDDDNIRRNEMKIVVPEVLKVILVDDWEAVTKNNQTVALPRSPTVEQLLKQFEEHIKTVKPPNLREPEILSRTIITGLQVYFDRSLGMNFALPPRTASVKIEENVEMSSIYGAEHLLRMLVAMPQMVANSQMDPESVGLVRDYVNELLKYMEAEKDRIFLREYETTSQSYQNTARS